MQESKAEAAALKAAIEAEKESEGNVRQEVKGRRIMIYSIRPLSYLCPG